MNIYNFWFTLVSFYTHHLLRLLLLTGQATETKILGKTAHLHTFFKIRAGRTAQIFDPNSEHKFFTDIYL